MTDHRSVWRRSARALARSLLGAVLGVLSAAGVASAQAPSAKVLEAPVAPPSQLAPVDTVTSHGVRFTRLEQRVGGHRVLGAEAVLADGPGTRGDLLVDDTRPRMAAPPEATLDRGAALGRARDASRVTILRADPQAELVVLPLAAGPRLVWRVVLPARRPLATPEVLVDARTGAIRRVRDLLQHATGTARIYDPNPVAQQGSAAGLADNGDADSATLTALRVPVTLPRLTDANTCLEGQWVRATLPGGDVCASGRDFTAATRSEDRFEALMAYFHLDRTQAYVQSLGFTNVVNRQFRVRVDDFPQDNSFYDPATGEISTGTGGVDDGEDADVLVHEYGHALQDSQVPGFPASDQAGAMSEGWADYLQAAISATYSSNHALDACMAEWDALSLGIACLRRQDTALKVADVWYGTSCNAEIHCASQPWSGALWTIRGLIGATTADRLVMQANFALTPGASFAQGSRTLLAADRQLYAGGNRDAIINALAVRGLIDPERVDDEPPDAAALAVPGSANGHLDIASDDHDVYAVHLAAGQAIVARVTAAAGDFDLRILKPGVTQVYESGAVLANVSTAGAVESLAYKAPAEGTYYVDVTVRSGAGNYALAILGDGDGDARADVEDDCPAVANAGQEDRDRDGLGDVCDRFADDPANDADADGHGANADNCPAAANADQADWDRDARGDACDRSARVSVTRITVRGRRLTIVGILRPRLLNASAWRVRIQREVCSNGGCRYRQLREVRGKRRLSNGRVTTTVRLAPGRYRLRPVLRIKAYRARAGGLRSLRIR